MVSIEQMQQAAKLDNEVIQHPEYVEAFNLLTCHVQMNHVAKLGSIITISGLSGSGKTVLVNALHENMNAESLRCVYVKVDSNEDYRTLALKFLRAVKSPIRFPIAAKAPEIMEVVAEQYAALGIQCVIIDEAQHMMNRAKNREAVAPSLSTDLDKLKMPIVLVGTEELEALRLSHAPFARRCSEVIPVKPFDTTTPEGIVRFQKLIGAFNRDLPIKLPRWVVSEEGMAFMRVTTAGLIGEIVPLFRHAVRRALIAGETVLTKERLLASEKLMAFSKHPNVREANARSITIETLQSPMRKSA